MIGCLPLLGFVEYSQRTKKKTNGEIQNSKKIIENSSNHTLFDINITHN